MGSKSTSINPKCAMCMKRGAAKPRRYHPYIPIEEFVLCVTCHEHLKNPRHLHPTPSPAKQTPPAPVSNRSNQGIHPNGAPVAMPSLLPNSAAAQQILSTSPIQLRPPPLPAHLPPSTAPPGIRPNGCISQLAALSSVQFQGPPPLPQFPFPPPIPSPRQPQIVPAAASSTTAAVAEYSGDSPVTVPSVYGDTSNIASYEREHISRLYILTEHMLWAGRKEPRFADFRERLRSDHLNGIYKSPTEEETKVDRRLINAASAVLAEVGVKLDAGKSRMVFPSLPIRLPPGEETRTTLEFAFSRDGLHLEAGIIWDKAFPGYSWEDVLSQHTIYECLFSLFGITVEPEKRTSKRRGAASTLILNRESVAKLLELASQYAPPTLKSLIVPLDTKSPNPLLTHAATIYRGGAKLPKPKTKRNGGNGNMSVADVDLCAWCLNVFDKTTYPYAKFSCTSCDMNLCSLCANRVLGASEMVSAIHKGGGYECLPCRVVKASEAIDKESASLEKRRRARMSKRRKRHIEDTMKAVSNNAESVQGPPRKRQKRTVKAFLSIAPQLAHIIQRIPIESRKKDAAPAPQAEASREETGFAKVVEDINIEYVKHFDEEDYGGCATVADNGTRKFVKHDRTVCIKCFLPLGVGSSDRNGNQATCNANGNCNGNTDGNGNMELNFKWNVYTELDGTNHVRTCSVEDCPVALHVGCLNSAGECGRHTCCVERCGSRQVTVRCRICTKAYCKEHFPHRNKIHIYSAKWIACEECATKLSEPVFPYPVEHEMEYKSNLPTGLDSDGCKIRNIKTVIERERAFAVDYINSMAKLHEKIDTRDMKAVMVGVKKVEKLFRKRMDARKSRSAANIANGMSPSRSAKKNVGNGLSLNKSPNGSNIANGRPNGATPRAMPATPTAQQRIPRVLLN